MHTRDFERVIIVHDGTCSSTPSRCRRRRRRSAAFSSICDALDPDVITGWNVVDFDLAVLSRVARRHGVHFAIGRNDDEFDLRKDASFTRESRAIVFGRQVLDGLSLMRGAFIRLDDYKLETAAQTFLGKGKLITGDGRHTEIEALYHDDPQRLVDYNLQDARLVTRDPRPDRPRRAGDRAQPAHRHAARPGQRRHRLDRFALPQRVAPARRGRAVGERRTSAPRASCGGYVMESKPGLYRNVLVFDFKSLYPSIIRTFNIDPLTHVRAADARSARRCARPTAHTSGATCPASSRSC